MQLLQYCNSRIIDAHSILQKINDDEKLNWSFEELSKGMTTNFFMKVNNTKVSVACSMDSGGEEIETLLFKPNGDIDHESVQYHDTPDALKKYLQNL